MPKKILFALLLLFAVSWVACKKVDIAFGDQLLDNGYTQVIRLDSFSTTLSTVYVDSFVTSAMGSLLVGGYNDPVFGKISSSSYFEVAPPSFTTSFVDTFAGARFDSIAIIMKTTPGYMGDTIKPVHVQVDRLSQPIVPYEINGTYLYNTNSFTTGTTLASTNISVRPASGQVLQVRLNDAFGLELIKKFQDPADQDMKSSEAFLAYLNGFRISADNNSSLLFTCQDSVVLRIFYRQPGLYEQYRLYDFQLASTAHQFNHIDVDRSAATLKNLPAQKEVQSSALNNTAYTLYAAGAMVKMRFPTVRDILKIPHYAKVLKATLTVRPLRGSYNAGAFTLPAGMRLSQTTQLNGIGTDLSVVSSDGSYKTLNGDLTMDELYGENTSYTYDVTNYIRGVVADGTYNQNGLLFLPSGVVPFMVPGRVIIGDNLNPLGKTELSILYASVQ